MTNKCVYLLLISVGVVVQAQIPNVGWCPDYLPMTDFDMNRFLGKWYEAERYFTFTEVVSRCVVTDYAKAPSGRIYVSNEVTNRLTGVKRIINGNLQLLGKGDEGKIHVKYATTPIPTETTLTVLETDYDNFAVVWSCNGFGPIHAQNAWLMTRERLPSGNVLQKGYGVLDKFKISRTFFVKTDQEGCYLAASDINAANGITAQSTVPEFTGGDQRDEGGVRTAGIVDVDKETPVQTEEAKPEAAVEQKPEEVKAEEVKPEEVKPTVQTDAAPVKIDEVKEVKKDEPVKVEEAPVEEPIVKPSADVFPAAEIIKPAVTIAEHILNKEEVPKAEENVVKS